MHLLQPYFKHFMNIIQYNYFLSSSNKINCFMEMAAESSTTTKGGGLIYADVTLGNPWRGGSRRKQKGIYALTNHPAPLPEAVVSEGRK
jgi:hypothetical protein